MKPVVLAAFLCQLLAAQPKFQGRTVTVTDPGTEPDGFFPKGPASVCIEKQCYTAPHDFGRFPEARLIQVEKDNPALLFSAASGGVSGYRIHFSLLRPGTGKDLDDLFMQEMEFSNISQHDFWTEPTISTAPVFVIAEAVWGPDETHYGPHRYIVSSYDLIHPRELGGAFYYLEDRYMTARKYDYDPQAKLHVLESEKQEALTRLRRLSKMRR